ncbi:zinc finger BED domain-containing protein RICESLEEPER 2-like protein [Tanacetum coccineum]|uniref:Zinc finger BED domain-containing protein RICESLEEPER 2-like protein n=1 Tax=Tanacetum coccineum TaxID=301880 RepID=A0ABQ5BK25_9ASTR
MFDMGSPSGPSQNASNVDLNLKTSSAPIGPSQGGADITIPSPKESSMTSIRAKKRKNIVDDDQGRKRQLTSEVWNHFDKEFVKGEWKAICKYCKKALSGEHGTNHLRNHFRIYPQRTTRDIKQIMLSTKVSLDGKPGLTKHMFDQGEARKELATMIILHEHPLCMVEHVGFRCFTDTIQPLFKPVSRNTIKKVTMDMYDVDPNLILQTLLKG